MFHGEKHIKKLSIPRFAANLKIGLRMAFNQPQRQNASRNDENYNTKEYYNHVQQRLEHMANYGESVTNGVQYSSIYEKMHSEIKKKAMLNKLVKALSDI